jgi:hypothetical protein
MKFLEEYIAHIFVKRQILKHITNLSIYSKGEKEEKDLWLRFEVKEFSPNRKYKTKLANYFWDKVDVVWHTYVAANMLMQGYIIFPILEGWIVASPSGEEYQIESNTCTCKSIGNYKGKCKHLVFRDWLLLFQSRVANYKVERKYYKDE